MLFDGLEIGRFEQNFRIGAEAIYQKAVRDRIEDSYMYPYGNFTAMSGGINSGYPQGTGANGVWNGQPDSWGNISVNGDSYYNKMGVIHAHKGQFDTFTYGVYVEDDAKYHLGSAGTLNARFGMRLDGDNFLNKNKLAPRFSLSYVAPWENEYKTQLTFGANRYYARNLLAYRFYAEAVNNRRAYYRTNPNEAWQHCGVQNANCVIAGNNYMSDGVVTAGNRLDSIDVPYDDELMGAFTQNLAGLFSFNLKYIHRDGKNQVTQENRGTEAAPRYFWGNNGYTKADIISLAVQNIAPIESAGIKHFYMVGVDWNNARRNYNSSSIDTDMLGNITYNGQAMRYEDMPAQKVNQPLIARINMTHTVQLGRVQVLWNNLFRYKGSYDRIVLESLSNTSTFVDKHFKPTFMWDMRLGFDVNIYGGNTLFVNFDIYNVLDSKNEVALSAADGIMLYGIPSNAALTTYELGRQFWTQVGYRF
ncbi:hypothetical protein LS71_006265 [Helicobacter jaachi]|uniref:TonB-dependent receptor n=1 Tax=Helicobacter jaachi TaxID=1677920 RepID=A0A4U8T9K7_9HELI|nr:hypothetical protein [Helicobacter jaachi]TLD96324.1 hypothetical protein LS71_006265 [Helicobacter jaachi]